MSDAGSEKPVENFNGDWGRGDWDVVANMCSDTPLDKVPEVIVDVNFGRGNLLLAVLIVFAGTVEMDVDGRAEDVDSLTDTYVFDQLS
jgi:hypothetical protein